MNDSARQAKQEACTREAVEAGSLAAAKALLLSSVSLAAALRFSPAFRRATGVSSRTALVISPFFGLFFLRSEQAMTACAQRRRELARALSA